MVKVKKSVLQACHGAILEAADVELERIIANNEKKKHDNHGKFCAK